MSYVELIESTLRKAYLTFQNSKKEQGFKEKIARGYGGDITFRFDEIVENAIVQEIKPKVALLLSEEKGIIQGEGNEGIVIIDPVDGSTNVYRGVPFCASTITISKGRKFKDIVASGTIDLISGDIFICDGYKTYFNEEEVKPSSVVELRETIASIDMKLTKDTLVYIERIKRLSEAIRYIRFFGAIALDLAYVASGKLDAFIVPSPRIRFLDVIGGLFMVKVSGGYIEIIDKGDLDEMDVLDTNRHAVLATGNDELAKKIKEIIY